jgi:Domain of unknown function DUF11
VAQHRRLVSAVVALSIGAGLSVLGAVPAYAAGASLVVRISHSGDFARGHSETFTLKVTNVGDSQAGQGYQLVDVLPSGFTGTAIAAESQTSCKIMSGDAIITCSSSEALSPGQTSSAITVTVAIAKNTPSQVLNSARVSSPDDPTGSTAGDLITIGTPGPPRITIINYNRSNAQNFGNATATTNGGNSISRANLSNGHHRSRYHRSTRYHGSTRHHRR